MNSAPASKHDKHTNTMFSKLQLVRVFDLSQTMHDDRGRQDY